MPAKQLDEEALFHAALLSTSKPPRTPRIAEQKPRPFLLEWTWRLVMHDLIEKHRTALVRLCERYHVRKLEVFGSATDDTFDPGRSDVDFLVEFLPQAAGRIFHGYFDFKEELERLFNRKVDLVMPSAIRNPYFQRAVDQQRKVLYAA